MDKPGVLRRTEFGEIRTIFRQPDYLNIIIFVCKDILSPVPLFLEKALPVPFFTLPGAGPEVRGATGRRVGMGVQRFPSPSGRGIKGEGCLIPPLPLRERGGEG
jgi:hypothetical protein